MSQYVQLAQFTPLLKVGSVNYFHSCFDSFFDVKILKMQKNAGGEYFPWFYPHSEKHLLQHISLSSTWGVSANSLCFLPETVTFT